jgi:hypothetical protein
MFDITTDKSNENNDNNDVLVDIDKWKYCTYNCQIITMAVINAGIKGIHQVKVLNFWYLVFEYRCNTNICIPFFKPLK